MATEGCLMMVFIWSLAATTATKCEQQHKMTNATSGHDKTLTCNTTCTLTDRVFIWFKNGRLIIDRKIQNNSLYLVSNSGEDAGEHYSYVKDGNEELCCPVLSVWELTSGIMGVVGIIVVLILGVFLPGFLWFRKKSSKSTFDTRDKAVIGQDEPSPVFDNVSSQALTPPTPQTVDSGHQVDVHYASIQFSSSRNQDVPLYSTAQLTQLQIQEEEVHYDAVKFNCPDTSTL
ncbi:uncharacterized protein LOC105029920 [Esox lucius]|uniref:uncharacterized protein LOC105029920 n=1 Tax=Esox lucius TaxID=8010 RepID=UPI0010BDD833|nr:uncharacterized protein LOC105029920 [Esox lucius]